MDWWTLGILTFELLSGHPPFESSYPMQPGPQRQLATPLCLRTYQKIMRGINKANGPCHT